ncbi:MAG: CDP-glycerol glycerophosphotransferase family protein [Patescibacteria group bacterium]
MKTIFLFIYPRLFISDLLRGEYIKYLSSKYKVVVFLENLDDSYYKSDNVIYIKFPFKLNKFRFWTIFESLLRINLIRRFDNFIGIKYRHVRYSGNDWRKNLLKFIAQLLPRKFFNPSFFYWFEKIFITHKKEFKYYIDKYNPSLVLTSGPGFYFMEGWAILCAKKFGIPTAAINFSWDNLTIYARSVRKTDYIICWNDIVKKDAQTIHGYKDNEVFVAGILRYDFLFKKDELGSREQFLKNKGLDPDKKTIFVATATDSDPDLHKKVINAIRDMNVNIYVRVHPLERMKTYEEFKKLNNVYIEYAGTVKQGDEERGWQTEMEKEDQVNLKKILKFCDLHINRSSTMTLDSLAFNLALPIINLKFPTSVVPVADYEHYKPIVDEGAVRLARNIDDAVRYVKMYLDNPLLDIENRKKVFDMMIKFSDGLSYKRSVDFLEKMIK